ncbi:MAG: hypothetical protein WC878_01845 [Candidatus Paceibacterota bacterium]|jgi:hypothetical protein
MQKNVYNKHRPEKRKAQMKEPTSIITVGRTHGPETISALLQKFNASYGEYSRIEINGKKAKRDYRIVSGGDVISLFKKEQ